MNEESVPRTNATVVVHAPTGQKLSLLSASTQSLIKGFVPLPGGGRAVVDSSGAVKYYRHPDWLGSSRLASTTSQTLYYDAAYPPYGEEYAATGPTPTGVFAGLIGDTGGGSPLWDATFREYDHTQGRWLSPDPAGLAAADPTNPQSWNRYAYVGNNPTVLIDPLGLSNVKVYAPPGWGTCTDFTDPETCTPGPCDIILDPGCFTGGGIAIGGDGGGGGSGSSGGSAGGVGSSGGVGAGGPQIGQASGFLGFQLACSQPTVIFPTPHGNVRVVNPGLCALYFLNINLGTFPVLANLATTGLVIAGSVTPIVPVAYVGGVGPSFPFAFSTQGLVCGGVGGAIGSVGKAINAGPLIGGDLANSKNVLSGLSYSVNVQSLNPAAGAQAIFNSSGLVYGPTGGTPGFSLSATYSFCGGTP